MNGVSALTYFVAKFCTLDIKIALYLVVVIWG